MLVYTVLAAQFLHDCQLVSTPGRCPKHRSSDSFSHQESSRIGDSAFAGAGSRNSPPAQIRRPVL